LSKIQITKPLIIKLHVEFPRQVLACQNDEFWDFTFSRELVAVFSKRRVARGWGKGVKHRVAVTKRKRLDV
jgi:hypothetical protein